MALLSNLLRRKTIFKIAKDSIEKAQKIYCLQKMSEYLHGSTFVSVEDAMTMQSVSSDLDNHKVRVTCDHINVN